MTTLLLGDLDPAALIQKIRRDNLRMAWRMRFGMTEEERRKLDEACRREWGESWRTAVETRYAADR